MQRYNQRMVEQLKVRQQQEKARLPKIQRSEGKTRMAMYKKSLHINGAGSASEQREKIKQVGALCVYRSGDRCRFGGAEIQAAVRGLGRGVSVTAWKPHKPHGERPSGRQRGRLGVAFSCTVPFHTVVLRSCGFLCW